MQGPATFRAREQIGSQGGCTRPCASAGGNRGAFAIGKRPETREKRASGMRVIGAARSGKPPPIAPRALHAEHDRSALPCRRDLGRRARNGQRLCRYSAAPGLGRTQLRQALLLPAPMLICCTAFLSHSGLRPNRRSGYPAETRSTVLQPRRPKVGGVQQDCRAITPPLQLRIARPRSLRRRRPRWRPWPSRACRTWPTRCSSRRAWRLWNIQWRGFRRSWHVPPR